MVLNDFRIPWKCFKPRIISFLRLPAGGRKKTGVKSKTLYHWSLSGQKISKFYIKFNYLIFPRQQRRKKSAHIWNLHRCLPVCFWKVLLKNLVVLLNFPTTFCRSADAGVRPRTGFVSVRQEPFFLGELRGETSKKLIQRGRISVGNWRKKKKRKVWLNAAIVSV